MIPTPTLPQDAADALIKAQQTPITPENPLARQVAIETVTERIKRRYPQFFKE